MVGVVHVRDTSREQVRRPGARTESYLLYGQRQIDETQSSLKTVEKHRHRLVTLRLCSVHRPR